MTKRMVLKRSQDILDELFRESSQEGTDIDDPQPLDSTYVATDSVSLRKTHILYYFYT